MEKMDSDQNNFLDGVDPPEGSVAEGNRPDEDNTPWVSNEDDQLTRQQMCKAREEVLRLEMCEAIRKKGLDHLLFSSYTINVTRPQRRGADKWAFTVSYVSPIGSILPCKGDVIQDIESRSKLNTHTPGTKDSTTDEIIDKRLSVFSELAPKTRRILSLLPLEIDGILVLSLGNVNPSTNFHSAVNVYPVGYSCEISFAKCIAPSSKHARQNEALLCEIKDVDGCPEFSITNKSTGATCWSSTEAGAWRKYEYGITANSHPELSKSFFNLDIELLIEGLEGVLECEDYKFHFERGYLTLYSNNEQLAPAKSAYATKYDREKRTKVRQEVRFLSPDEKKRREVYAQKKSAEEVQITKEQVAQEKLRKELERETDRMRKEQSKEEARLRKEAQKAKEDHSRNMKKDEERQLKEKQRAEERYRLSYRRGTNKEVRAKKEEMTMQVLRAFDQEEAYLVKAPSHSTLLKNSVGSKTMLGINTQSVPDALKISVAKGLGLPGNSPPTLDTFLSTPRSADDFFHLTSEKIDFDDIFQMCNMARLLKGVLGLEFSCDLEHMINNLKLVAPPPENLFPVSEYEHAGRNQAEAELDRWQLCLVRKLMENSNPDKTNMLWMLDLQMPREDQLVVYARLPLNQLTWPEVARQALITHTMTRMGREWEDTQAVLRGSKVSSAYRQAKNVYRFIRFRWQTRMSGSSSSSCSKQILDLGHPQGSIEKALFFDKCQRLGQCNKRIEFVLGPANLNSQSPGLDIPGEYSRQSDAEIVASLLSAAAATPPRGDSPNSKCFEIYSRCMKVLIKVLSLSQSKSFIRLPALEEGSLYYKRVKNPMSLSIIAGNLFQKLYGLNDPIHVVSRFYSDMTLVAMNSFTFNTEHLPLNSQALKIWQSMFRHVQSWVLADDPLPVAHCTEHYCLMSHVLIQLNQGMRCGRCTGCYSLDALGDIIAPGSKDPRARFVVFPSEQLIHATQHEEWFCPLCLMEDSTTLAPLNHFSYHIDEMGPSVMQPWQLNKTFSHEAHGLYYDFPDLRYIVEAINILSASDRTAISEKRPSVGSGIDWKHSPCVPRTWGVADRVKVLLGLCDMVMQLPETAKFLESTQRECEKLKKLCANVGLFKDTDFMRIVKNLTGDEGLAMCKDTLDGLGEVECYEGGINRVFEGRCIMCKISTCESGGGLQGERQKPRRGQSKVAAAAAAAAVATAASAPTASEGDANAPSANADTPGARPTQGNTGRGRGYKKTAEELENEIVLCDGCNAEAHLKCLNMTAVPTEDWHCKSCEARAIFPQDARSSDDYGRFMAYKQRDLEDELVNRLIDTKALEDGLQLRNSEQILEGARAAEGTVCSYCGENELQGCSPMVLGMTRVEHDEWCTFAGDIVMETPMPLMDLREHRARPGTKVYFAVQGEWVLAPALEIPYFPLLASPHGQDLQEHCDESGLDLPGKGVVIVHEHCALEMFQARVNRTKHEIRRKRNLIAEQIMAMTGVSVRSLGVDFMGNEYWKFPTSRSLFLCTFSGNQPDADKERFLQCLGEAPCSLSARDIAATYDLPPGDVNSRKWKVIANFDEIRVLADLLCSDHTQGHRVLGEAILRAFSDPAVHSVFPGRKAPLGGVSSSMEVENETKDDDGDSSGGRPEAEFREDTPMQMETDGHDDTMGNEGDFTEPSSKRSSGKFSGNGVENVVGIRLLTSKGTDIHPVCIISSESVFDEPISKNSDENDEDGYSTSEYLRFAKKFHAIELVNASDKRVRLSKGAATVTFQIQREGVQQSIGLTHLSDPWSDGLYYFRTATFLRSGRYTLSFFIEGITGSSVKPLVFEVMVQSRTIRCGPDNALERLVAQGFVKAEGRRTGLQRRLVLERRIGGGHVHSDLEAVRAAIITVFVALPQGCLNLSENEDEGLTEGLGWNDNVESAWITMLEAATHPTELMECILILESCISKAWYLPPTQIGPIMNALPNPNFAIRCGTLSAVALRIFVLDRVVNYSNFVAETRPPGGRRSRDGKKGGGGNGAGGDSGRKKQKSSYSEMEEDDDER